MEQCLARRIKDKEEARGRFQDGHRYFLEYRCANTVAKGQNLCATCGEWTQRGLKLKDPYRNVHGLITQPIPEWSHIYEGPWYESKVALYGIPSDEQMARAKKAQGEARAQAEPVAVPVTVAEPVTVSVPLTVPEAPVTKPKRKPKAEGETVKAPTKRKPKTVPVTPTVEQPVVTVKAVEALEPIKETFEVIPISVKKTKLNGKAYFLDTKKQKLYSVGSDGQPSQYVGRWNSEEEKVDTSYPDSDNEF